MKNLQTKFKVSIIGCGNVGATTAYTLLMDGTPSEILVFDIDRDKSKGLVLDFQHSAHFVPTTKLTSAQELEEVQDSELIIITAGQKQKPGQSRLELIEANKRIFDQIIPTITQSAPNAILLIVTNPVDVLTHYAQKISKLPPERVFGTGTLLDTARFRSHLSQLSSISPKNIHAYILGEHGDNSFPAISSANIAGQPITDIIPEKQILKAYQDTQQAAYRIINDLGYTCYSIAQVCNQITKAIAENSNQIFPLTTVLKGQYGLKNIALSTPCQLGGKGIQKVLEVPLNKSEQKQLKQAEKVIRELL